ncbi:flagellar export chaperone FlgN [Alkaliphilus serpentinus]|uniref:Flagellar protein FlgN n=1 Tax=Alkaliphilus serpentinus TaxID=1482731 RepID=A0A833HQK0_9FIRM|nr:flagellar export chaperone FlgN [Alkaliphilus serpentinus]KAB3532051.1 flagellar protein FlgN [Alkaliphilus serpentinus]
MNPQENVAILKHVSTEKLKLVKELLELTIKQKESLLAAEDNSTELLNRIVEEKQCIITTINHLDYDFSSNYDALLDSLGLKSLEGIKEEPVKGFKELKLVISEIMTVMQKIKILDDENHRLAIKNMEAIKGQLKTMKTGKMATNSYGKKYKESPSIFIDRKR